MSGSNTSAVACIPESHTSAALGAELLGGRLDLLGRALRAVRAAVAAGAQAGGDGGGQPVVAEIDAVLLALINNVAAPRKI